MSREADRTNREWLDALRSGGDRADAALGDLQQVLRTVLRRGLQGRRGVDDGAVDDFVQDATLKVLDGLDGFRGDSRFTTWASAVAIRTALAALRRAHWRDLPLDDALPDLDAVGEPADGGDLPAETRVQRRQIHAAIHRAIRRDLTERRRIAILSELAGVPHAVIAERLGMKRNALYKLAHDARKSLRASLEREGFTAEDVRAAFPTGSKGVEEIR